MRQASAGRKGLDDRDVVGRERELSVRRRAENRVERAAYESVEWPVIVLLGRIGDLILAAGGRLPPAAMVLILLVGTMWLSDVVNNAAAALLMAPVALNVMAVAVGLPLILWTWPLEAGAR
ncbi:MAG TPA: hypothetical protein VF044_03670 [Actinomycetota bacterium]